MLWIWLGTEKQIPPTLLIHGDMCEYTCKTRGSFKTHLAQKHNINIQCILATYARRSLKITRICKDVLPTSTVFTIKSIMKDTSIIQQTLVKEQPEDTKSIEFVNTHKANCNNSISQARHIAVLLLCANQTSSSQAT